MKKPIWILVWLMIWATAELMAQAGGNASGSSKGSRAAQQSRKQARDISSNGSPVLSRTSTSQVSSGSQASGHTTDQKKGHRPGKPGSKVNKNQ
ncbi:hypothetical protein [Spirosoma aerolatum]|uniref:hypothetical protein n=1 Tax=Spirosoma aerolatum TaxID=1211326 RepID=UPI0012D2E853|nr:hypothetical protein [Spirosoma aerolatum]